MRILPLTYIALLIIFLTSSHDIVSNFDVLDSDINFSDHNPIALTCQISVDKRAVDSFDKNHDQNVAYPLWDHAQAIKQSSSKNRASSSSQLHGV